MPYDQNFPDPHVLRVGGAYYAYATVTGGAYLPVMSSTDLRVWTPRPAYDPGAPLNSDPYFNDALPYPARWAPDRPVEGRLKKTIWAPGVAKIGARFVAFYAVQTALGEPGRFCISVATATEPLGPFRDDTTEPLVCDADPGGSIDPAPFVDDDGTPFLLWKSEGVPGSQPTRIWVRRLDPGGTAFAPGSAPTELLRTSLVWEGNVIENSSLVRHGGKLYLFYSGNEWRSAAYAIGYAECASPTGPCVKRGANPLLASRDGRLGPGGSSAFVDAQGQLQLAYHYWNAPYTDYPAYPGCEQTRSCTTQGQRRLRVEPVYGSGPALRVGDFSDVPPGTPLHEAVSELAARGIIRGFPDGTFQPGATTLRAQMAALIARAMGWEGEDWGNRFPDQGAVDAALWRNVGTLAHYDVARGFPDGTYKPTADVARAQTVSFIARGMVARGYWTLQPDNPALYPNVPASSGHRRDLATYVHYVGALPDRPAAAAWTDWAAPATRGWFALVLWQALEGAGR